MTRSQAFSSRGLWLTLGALLLVLVAAIAVFAQQRSADPAATSESQETSEENSEKPTLSSLARHLPEDPLALGDPDAPITIIEFADFRCSYCGLFSSETFPSLVSEFVDSGKVRVEWHHTIVFGQDSQDAAIAATAAGQQGLFWEMNQAIYATEPNKNTPFPRERLLEIASSVPGLDLDVFAQDLDDPAIAQLVTEQAQRAQQLGVSATPTFIVGDQVVQGAQPIDAFRSAIEAELAQ